MTDDERVAILRKAVEDTIPLETIGRVARVWSYDEWFMSCAPRMHQLCRGWVLDAEAELAKVKAALDATADTPEPPDLDIHGNPIAQVRK